LKKKNFAEYIFEIIGFLKILASPFLLGIAIGLGFYIKFNNKTGLVIWILFAFCGLIGGIFWGLKVWKKTGTFNYISKIVETTTEEETKKE